MTVIRKPTQTDNRELLRSERIAGGILPRVLSSFDMIVIVVAIVLWLPNAAIITSAGPSAYLYWILGIASFLIPSALISAQLGLMFPKEGSIYIWTTKALGDFSGFLAGFCAWWSGILGMITGGVMVVTLIQYLGSLYGRSFFSDSGSQGLVIIGVLCLSFVLSTLRFRLAQNIMNVTFFLYMGIVLLIGTAGFTWLWTGHASAVDFSLHTGKWGLNEHNFSFYGIVLLELVGIETPLNMGVEIHSKRAITRYLFWGTLLIVCAYLLTTFGIMVTVPAQDQGKIISLVESIQWGFGPAGTFLATFADLALIAVFVAITTVYNYSFARLLFVSGLDRRLPAIISKINSNKVPWVAILAQTIISITFSALIFILSPLSFKSSTAAGTIFSILSAAIAVFWCISIAALFVDVIIIRRKFAELFARVQFIPGWLFLPCALIGILSSIVGILVTFTVPWVNTIATSAWDIWIISIILLSLIVAVVGFYLGKATVKNNLSDEEIIQVVTN